MQNKILDIGWFFFFCGCLQSLVIGFTKYALNYVKNALESYNIGEFVSNNVTMLFLKVVSQPIQCEKHNWGINCVASGWGHEMLNKNFKILTLFHQKNWAC